MNETKLNEIKTEYLEFWNARKVEAERMKAFSEAQLIKINNKIAELSQ